MAAGLRKNLPIRMLCLVLALLVVLPAGALADWGTVNNPNPQDRLNLRTSPSTSATSLMKYFNGVDVEIQSYYADGWATVTVGNLFGFMQTKFLAINASPGSVRSAIPTAYVNNANPTERLNLRAMRSQDSEILGRYLNGTAVQVLGISDTWWHVSVDGKVGYMMGKFLKYNGYTPAPAPQPQPQPSQTTYAVVNNPNPQDRLNLRTSVGAGGQKGYSVAKYYSGVKVEVRGYPPEAPGWVYVRIGNLYGYMQQSFLAFGNDMNRVRSAIPVLTVQNPNSIDRLNLRETASDQARSLGRYYNGTRVEVLGLTTDGIWYHVRVDGMMGFMMARFLK